MIRSLARYFYRLKYGRRGGIKPPLGPESQPFYRYRFFFWKLESRVYEWTGIVDEWRQCLGMMPHSITDRKRHPRK